MSNDTINIKAGGDVAFAKDEAIATINKTISESGNIPETLEDKLKELTTAVDTMMKDMPDDEAEEATENLEILVKQAQKDKPQKALCQVSSEGLIEAAKAVGDIAKPVITTVQAVMKLLIP